MAKKGMSPKSTLQAQVSQRMGAQPGSWAATSKPTMAAPLKKTKKKGKTGY